MQVGEAVFLSLIFVGVGLLVLAVVRARRNWRPDAPGYRETRYLDLLLHPERYARGKAVSGIRVLNIGGLLAMAGAFCILLVKAFTDFYPIFTH